MTNSEALTIANEALSFAIDLLIQAQKVSAMIAKANSEGRELSAAEIQRVHDAREAARLAAIAAVQAAP